MKLLDKDIIYLDNHILVVNKPPGLPTQPRPEGGESLEEAGKVWLKEKYKKPGNVFLVPIHRLDRQVSGLVLFARTSKSLSRLQEEMRERKIQKTYYARVEGKVKKETETLCHFIGHGSHRAYETTENEGKKALLTYRVVEENEDTTLLEIDLQTGRYHQIRLQLSLIGHPICGDVKYGAKEKKQGEKIDLHHGKLSFFHPITKEKITVRTPFPF